MEFKIISKPNLKNIISDYDNFMDACEEANRYAGSKDNFIMIDDEILEVV